MADEHGGRELGDPELAHELRLCARWAIGECPSAFVHAQPSYGDGRTEPAQPPGQGVTGAAARFTGPMGGWGFGME